MMSNATERLLDPETTRLCMSASTDLTLAYLMAKPGTREEAILGLCAETLSRLMVSLVELLSEKADTDAPKRTSGRNRQPQDDEP